MQGPLLGRAEGHGTRQVHWSQRLVSSFGSKPRKNKNFYEGTLNPVPTPTGGRAWGSSALPAGTGTEGKDHGYFIPASLATRPEPARTGAQESF